jgi:hypothetical protein
MRVIKNIKRKFIPRRGSKINYTTMRVGTKTDRGIVKVCKAQRAVTDEEGRKTYSVCNRKGAVKLNKAMGMYFVTHHALIRPDGQFKSTDFCLESGR